MHSDLVSKWSIDRNTCYEPSGTVLFAMQIDCQLAGPAQRQSEEMLQRIDLLQTAGGLVSMMWTTVRE